MGGLSVYELHHDVERVARIEALSVLDDVGILEQLQEVDLALQQLQLVLGLAAQRHLLDRDEGAGLKGERLEDGSRGAAANLVCERVLLREYFVGERRVRRAPTALGRRAARQRSSALKIVGRAAAARMAPTD